MKIAHFVTDDKFTDSAYFLFEETHPLQNTFFLPKARGSLKHIKKTKIAPIGRLEYLSRSFISSLNRFDLIVLHSLNSFNREIVCRCSMSTKFVWIGLGFDYYDLIFSNERELYYPKTWKIRKAKSSLPRLMKDALARLVDLALLSHKSRSYVLEKISFFSPVLESEYTTILRNYDGVLPAYIRWNYSVFPDNSTLLKQDTVALGNNLLLGNSATPSNNHLEMIDTLALLIPDEVKVVCPLSYGDSSYAEYIQNYGKEILGNRFISLIDFVPYEAYLELISSCSNVIMNHKRQQGAGNTHVMIHMGAKVFLRKSNPLYCYYRQIGVHVFSIDELEKNPGLLESTLEPEVIEANRLAIARNFGQDKLLDNTINLVREAVAK